MALGGHRAVIASAFGNLFSVRSRCPRNPHGQDHRSDAETL